MNLTMRDVRAAGMCSSGVREFFKRHDLDWNDFLKNGISTDRLSHIDNVLIEQVKAAADGRQETSNGRV